MAEIKLTPQLELERCPHCAVARPLLSRVFETETRNQAGQNLRLWKVYSCATCGGLVTAAAHHEQTGDLVREVYPETRGAAEDLPDTARTYLQQAMDSLHAPAGAVMLAASAVDAMLKAKGYTEGSLYSRIDQAAKDHLITKEMALWAHEVRLDANDQRHADQHASLPEAGDAARCIFFASALGDILFVLPKRVERGRSEGEQNNAAT